DRTLQANANLETHGAMMIDALKAKTAIDSVREDLYAKNMVVSTAIGEQVYQEVCTACHAFDKVVLGPAHDKTLPKYLNNPEGLVEFLKNPTKVDPAFPAMPNPGLTSFKIKSVVKFLMGRMGKEWPPETGEKKDKTTNETKDAENKSHE
ncbi:MAG: cytochrome c, partial [bacterium]|nr:cytochrome c [bacterium]